LSVKKWVCAKHVVLRSSRSGNHSLRRLAANMAILKRAGQALFCARMLLSFAVLAIAEAYQTIATKTDR